MSQSPSRDYAGLNAVAQARAPTGWLFQSPSRDYAGLNSVRGRLPSASVWVSIPQSGLRRFEPVTVYRKRQARQVSIPQSGLRRFEHKHVVADISEWVFQSPSRDYAGLNRRGMSWSAVAMLVSIPQSGLRRFEPAARFGYVPERVGFNPPVGITPV